MRLQKIVLELLPRLIATIVLWDAIRTIIEGKIFGVVVDLLSGIEAISIESVVKLGLALSGSILATLTVALASPTLYVATLIIIAIARASYGLLISMPSVVGLIAMLVLDTMRSYYRSGQEKSVRIGFKATFVTITMLIATLIGFAGLCYLPAVYVNEFISMLSNVKSATPQEEMFLSFLTQNPIPRLIIAAAFTALLFNYVSKVMEIAANFLYPSRKLSIALLTNRKDIDIYITTPLKIVKNIVIASIIAPPIYASVIYGVLPLINRYVGILSSSMSGIDPNVLRLIISIIVYIVAYALVSRFLSERVFEDPKALLKPSIIAIVLIIVGALAISGCFRNPWMLLEKPLNILSSLDSITIDIYRRYYEGFIYVLEVLSKLVGLVP